MKCNLTITGMHCANCVRRLTDALSKTPGVASAQVSLSPPEAQLETQGHVPLEALQAAASKAGAYIVTESTASKAQHGVPPVVPTATPEKKPSLYPLILIVAYIAGTVGIVAWARGPWGPGAWSALMLDFMAGFFLVFSFFKLLDLQGFADAYQSYDILARPFRPWALAYPFIELALGVAYLTRWNLTLTSAATLGLMLVGSIGVLKAVLSKRRIRCACLGTALNLPMTTVTLVEDLGMAAMAAVALIWSHA